MSDYINPVAALPWITDRPPTYKDAWYGHVMFLYRDGDGDLGIETVKLGLAQEHMTTGRTEGCVGWLHCPSWTPDYTPPLIG